MAEIKDSGNRREFEDEELDNAKAVVDKFLKCHNGLNTEDCLFKRCAECENDYEYDDFYNAVAILRKRV